MKLAIPALADGQSVVAKTPYDGEYKIFVADFNQEVSKFVCALRGGDWPDNLDVSMDIPIEDLDRQLKDGFELRPGKNDNRKMRLKEIVDSLLAQGVAKQV